MASLKTLQCRGCDDYKDTYNPRAVAYTCKIHENKSVRGAALCTRCGLWLDSLPDVKEVLCGSCAFISTVEAELAEKKYCSVPPDFLKEIRSEVGITQQDLHYKIDVPTGAISRAERGKELPQRDHVDWANEEAIDLGIDKDDYDLDVEYD